MHYAMFIVQYTQLCIVHLTLLYSTLLSMSLSRVHYVSKLKALDTSEKDRALADLEKEKTNSREIQLRLDRMFIIIIIIRVVGKIISPRLADGEFIDPYVCYRVLES